MLGAINGSLLGEDDGIALGEGLKSQSPTMIELSKPMPMVKAPAGARTRPHTFAFAPMLKAPLTKIVPCKILPTPMETAPLITQKILSYVAPFFSTMYELAPSPRAPSETITNTAFGSPSASRVMLVDAAVVMAAI